MLTTVLYYAHQVSMMKLLCSIKYLVWSKMQPLAVIYLLCLSDKPGRRVYDVVVGATSKVGESTWLLARAVLITYCVSAAAPPRRRGKQRQPLAPSCRLPSLSEIRYEIQHSFSVPCQLHQQRRRTFVILLLGLHDMLSELCLLKSISHKGFLFYRSPPDVGSSFLLHVLQSNII